MEERQEQPDAVSPADGDDSPKGVAENVREAGKALSLTVVLGILVLFVCLGFAFAYTGFHNIFFGTSHLFWEYHVTDAVVLVMKLFALLLFLAGAGYAFRKFPLEKIRKGMYWLMGGAVTVMIIATIAVTMSRS